MPAVSVRHLAKSYGDKQAVRDVSFDVEKGDVFALLGPNGAGKTTTIEILEGFRDRSGGEVETLGVDPADRSTQRWLRSRIRKRTRISAFPIRPSMKRLLMHWKTRESLSKGLGRPRT